MYPALLKMHFRMPLCPQHISNQTDAHEHWNPVNRQRRLTMFGVLSPDWIKGNGIPEKIVLQNGGTGRPMLSVHRPCPPCCNPPYSCLLCLPIKLRLGCFTFKHACRYDLLLGCYPSSLSHRVWQVCDRHMWAEIKMAIKRRKTTEPICFENEKKKKRMFTPSVERVMVDTSLDTISMTTATFCLISDSWSSTSGLSFKWIPQTPQTKPYLIS